MRPNFEAKSIATWRVLWTNQSVLAPRHSNEIGSWLVVPVCGRGWREYGRWVEDTSGDVFVEEMGGAAVFKLNNVRLTLHLREIQDKGKDKHQGKPGNGWRIEKSETRMWDLVMTR